MDDVAEDTGRRGVSVSVAEDDSVGSSVDVRPEQPVRLPSRAAAPPRLMNVRLSIGPTSTDPGFVIISVRSQRNYREPLSYWWL